MPDFPHLSKAPIVEALIDFRVRPKKGIGPKELAAMHGRIKDRYPTSKAIRELQTRFEVKEGEAPQQSVEQKERGYRFESTDGRYVLQVRVDGFTLSRLKPYEDWEALIDETQSIWRRYVELLDPESVIRVATRFINRVEIPVPMGKFEEFFTAPPVVPKGLPEFVSEYFSRVVINDPNTGAMVIFTQALEPIGPSADVVPYLVDIDVFKEDTFGVASEELWKLLAEFRSLKNRAFFASLTPKTVELLR